MISYIESTDGITLENLQGFFVGWPNPPTPQTHLRILNGSNHVVIAIDTDTGDVVGFINALTDGVIYAYIPLLEVLPQYQGMGIGSGLVRRMLEKLSKLYAIDILCDPELQPFYARFGMLPSTGVLIRNYNRQSGNV